ncbi:MAG: hypothetical protein BMS9Abin05_2201 [Rhodothermia bacterium]|nr:MAG: hypothetical protein BMS9Abin05_2201 [Rhodothermia bacterium]
MAGVDHQITEEQAALIRSAPVFFIASADPELADGPGGLGPVNLSPKGGTPLHILTPNRVAYLDFGGSGNEIARHASMNGPATIMICSFEQEDAAIVRLYGKTTTESIEGSEHEAIVRDGVGEDPVMRDRQIVVMEVERTMTSCGYTLPVMDFIRERRKEDRGGRYKT